MARRRRPSPVRPNDSGDSDFCPFHLDVTAERASNARTSPRKNVARSYRDVHDTSDDDAESASTLAPTSVRKLGQSGRQVRLTPLNALPGHVSLHDRSHNVGPDKPRSCFRSRLMPDAETSAPAKSSDLCGRKAQRGNTDGDTDVEVEDSLWVASDGASDTSDNELPSASRLLAFSGSARARSRGERFSRSITRPQSPSQDRSRKATCPDPAVLRPSSSSDKENHAAFLRFSPPRLYSPDKQRQTEAPLTPPQSPSKSRLQSPSKQRSRVRTPDLRQSLDAFWNATTINDWNDTYSPQKILKSPKKIDSFRDGEPESPTTSPNKSRSPSKGDKEKREARRNFESRKRALAEAFLVDLDQQITDGELQRLAQHTGGIQLNWSKTLNSTAGRANWRKETTKTTQPDGTLSTTHAHFATIELAEKVISDEHRLLNVIAHEFCHLANFMISGVKDQPHGRSFKDWGRKCTLAFGDRGVEVTTKHSYRIEYKYAWKCGNEGCGAEFQRHSKSIDPQRHACGSCRGKLVQIKPVPRRDAGGKGATGYAAFVKGHFAGVKASMPGASQKEVMEAVARKYRAEKAAKNEVVGGGSDKSSVSGGVDVDAVARELGVIRLDD